MNKKGINRPHAPGTATCVAISDHPRFAQGKIRLLLLLLREGLGVRCCLLRLVFVCLCTSSWEEKKHVCQVCFAKKALETFIDRRGRKKSISHDTRQKK